MVLRCGFIRSERNVPDVRFGTGIQGPNDVAMECGFIRPDNNGLVWKQGRDLLQHLFQAGSVQFLLVNNKITVFGNINDDFPRTAGRIPGFRGLGNTDADLRLHLAKHR